MPSLAERSARGRQVLVAGVAVNSLLALLKLGVGWLGNSSALVADGLESTLDVLSSAMIWGALKYAERPPDSGHPYGHGKMESLAGAGGAILLLVAGVLVATSSLGEVLGGGLNRPAPAPFTLAVLVAVVVVKEGLFHLASRRGREVSSSAVQSDAWHHRSDAITSLAAAIGITVCLTGGPAWVSADNWAALFSCAIIAFNGLRMLKVSLGELLDQQAPDEVIEAIMGAARSVEGVDNVEKCRVRKSGLSLIADIHVRVRGDVTVTDGHSTAHRVKDALMGGDFHLLDVTVHIEPT
ncbi:MAG: cation diffusion facilitator family transporter [Terrimicrobiaceae bacterium]